jgi:anti-anti-sigma factor
MHFTGPEELDGLSGPRSFRPSGRIIVTLRGDLDFAAAPALRERLIDVLHRGIDLLILDLSHVPSCDATGLAVLVATQRRAGLLGITMRLVAPSLPVSKFLGSTGLKRHFAICSELPGALATDRPEPAGLISAPAILPAADGAGAVAVHTMVLDENGCSQTSCSCHSACEF